MKAIIMAGQEKKMPEDKDIEIEETTVTKRTTLKKINEDIVKLEAIKKEMEIALEK